MISGLKGSEIYVAHPLKVRHGLPPEVVLLLHYEQFSCHFAELRRRGKLLIRLEGG